MKNLVLSIALTSITFIALFAPPVKAILPDSSDYKQAKESEAINLKACKKNSKNTRINGSCILFYGISSENSEVYRRINGAWQPVKLKMFDNPIFGKVSLINIIKFDKEWAYGFTSNKTPGHELFRFRMNTISYNYGC
jgi:hypothetical protein